MYMSNKVQNKLRFLIGGVLLLLALFIVVAFVVPFEAKFNYKFWVSFACAVVNCAAAVTFMLIPLNADGYDNDNCANKTSILAVIMAVLGIALGVIFMAVTVRTWIAAVVISVEFVIVALAALYFLVTGKEKKQE